MTITQTPFTPTTGTVDGNVRDENGSEKEGVLVTLINKDETLQSEPYTTTTSDSGYYEFRNVPFGWYDVIATFGEGEYEQIGKGTVVVSASGIYPLMIELLPVHQKTEVESENSSIGNVSAGGLEDVFTAEDVAYDGSSSKEITVTLQVSDLSVLMADEATTDEEKAQMEEDKVAASELVTASEEVALYLDASLLKTIATTTSTETTTNSAIVSEIPDGGAINITLELPSYLAGQAPYTIVHVHHSVNEDGDDGEPVIEVSRIVTIYDELTNTITFPMSKFSTIALLSTPPVIENSGMSSTKFYTDEMNFWNEVKLEISEAEIGEVIEADAKYYTRMPWTVMEMLLDKDVTLALEWDSGDDIVITQDTAKVREPNRIYWPMSYLEELYPLPSEGE